MKRRLIAGGIVLLVLWVCMVPVAYNLDVLLSGGRGLEVNPLTTLVPVLRNSAARRLLLLLMGVAVVGVVACLTAGAGVSSRTDMQHLTPDIEIPAEAGQGQFGTARFLPENQYKKSFSGYDLSSEEFDTLKKEGKEDGKQYDR